MSGERRSVRRAGDSAACRNRKVMPQIAGGGIIGRDNKPGF
jgi:hypothetical protein